MALQATRPTRYSALLLLPQSVGARAAKLLDCALDVAHKGRMVRYDLDMMP
jgi:hypothetical protein